LVLLAAGCGPTATARDPRCPSSTPAQGAPCSLAPTGFLSCEYGDTRSGTTRADCVSMTNGATYQWLLVPLNQTPNAGACASSYAAAHSGSCTANVNLACDYAEGRCACVCRDTTVVWACRDRVVVDAQTGVSCPEPRPLVGTPCAPANALCPYDAICGNEPLSFGPLLQCANGYWEATVDTAQSCTFFNCPGWTGSGM
jgi:hypothetical protein